MVGLLWWLARSTWHGLEKVRPMQSSAEPDVWTPLEDRAMWNGRAAVRRLRALHVSTGLVVPGAFAVAPLGGAVPPGVRGVVLVLLLTLLGLMAVLVALPATGRRERRSPPSNAVAPGTPTRTAEQERAEQERAERHGFYRWLPLAALVLTAAALVVAAAAPAAARSAGPMPYLVGAVQGLFVGQGALLVLLTVACVLLARVSNDHGFVALIMMVGFAGRRP